MQWQVTVQDALIWVSDGQRSVELSPQPLKVAPAPTGALR
jgi:uncharacterized protein YaeQ